MKKLVTLLLALLLSLSLTVPALAENLRDVTLSGEHPNTYNNQVNIFGSVTVAENAVITCNNNLFVSGSLTAKAGATVTVNKTLHLARGAKLTIGGRLEGKSNMDIDDGSILLLPGGEVDVVLNFKEQADKLVSKLLADNGKEKIDTKIEQFADGYHVTAHGHDFEDGVCAVCGVSAQNSHEEVINGGGGEGAPASTLSQGSATVVCTIAAFVLGFAAATVIFTRKKTKG